MKIYIKKKKELPYISLEAIKSFVSDVGASGGRNGKQL
jgi:hypothetical protein